MTGLLIGITGRIRSGKDTVASFLIDYHGFRRFAFADALKQLLEDVNPMIVSEHSSPDSLPPADIRLADLVGKIGWDTAKLIPEVRRLQRQLGHMARVRLGEDVWVDAVMKDVRPLLAAGIDVVVSDVRYRNEATAITESGGAMVRVIRPFLVADASHVSDTELDDYPCDWSILNTGTLAELEAKTDRIVCALDHPSRAVAGDDS